MSARVVNGVRRYGFWAGNPDGTPEDPTRCIEEVGRRQGSATAFGQCANPRVEGTLYCWRHNPDAVAAKEKAASAARIRKEKQSEANAEEARRLGRALGVRARSNFNSYAYSYSEELIISFEDARKLIARLRASEGA